MDNALVTVSEEATVMTAAQHRARCASLRGGMTLSEAAIIHDLETLETDYHMLMAEMKARVMKCRGMAVRHSAEGCEECGMLLEEIDAWKT